MPTIHEVPNNVRVGHVETPSPYTEYGIKGGGEGGRMGAARDLRGNRGRAAPARRQGGRAAVHAAQAAHANPRSPAIDRLSLGRVAGDATPSGLKEAKPADLPTAHAV